LNDQVTRLSALIKDLKKKYKVCQGQVRSLIDERADFITQLQDRQHELMVLRQRLGIAQKENEDLSQSHVSANIYYIWHSIEL
jgi:predicted nuclease with TOPRIM domain